jgi:hypothetical protein
LRRCLPPSTWTSRPERRRIEGSCRISCLKRTIFCTFYSRSRPVN